MKEVRNTDIISDLRFVQPNECFKTVGKKTQKEGKVTSNIFHLLMTDLKKMEDYFVHDVMNDHDPKKFQKCLKWLQIQMNANMYIKPLMSRINHVCDKSNPANQTKVYEQPGNPIFHVITF